MRTALGTLPWVEQDSITADVGTHIATFAVKDASQFNLEQVKEALKGQNFSEVELISAPGTGAAAVKSRSDKSAPAQDGTAAATKPEASKPAGSETSDSGKKKPQP